MNDTRTAADIAEIKGLLKEQSRRQQETDLANEGRLTRMESGIAEIKSDVAAIARRGEADHDAIVRLQSQMAFRPAAAAVLSTTLSIVCAYLGLRPPAQ